MFDMFDMLHVKYMHLIYASVLVTFLSLFAWLASKVPASSYARLSSFVAYLLVTPLHHSLTT